MKRISLILLTCTLTLVSTGGQNDSERDAPQKPKGTYKELIIDKQTGDSMWVYHFSNPTPPVPHYRPPLEHNETHIESMVDQLTDDSIWVYHFEPNYTTPLKDVSANNVINKSVKTPTTQYEKIMDGKGEINYRGFYMTNDTGDLTFDDDEFISILNNDVLGFFHDYRLHDSDLKIERFKKTDEYHEQVQKFASIRHKVTNTKWTLMIPIDEDTRYSINNKGFLLIANRLSLDVEIPNCQSLNEFIRAFKSLKTSSKKSTPYINFSGKICIKAPTVPIYDHYHKGMAISKDNVIYLKVLDKDKALDIEDALTASEKIYATFILKPEKAITKYGSSPGYAYILFNTIGAYIVNQTKKEVLYDCSFMFRQPTSKKKSTTQPRQKKR